MFNVSGLGAGYWEWANFSKYRQIADFEVWAFLVKGLSGSA